MNIQLDEEETSINDNIFFRKINKLKIDDLLKKKLIIITILFLIISIWKMLPLMIWKYLVIL